MVKSEPQVVIVPGYTNSGPKHWQSLWEEKHPEYKRVQQRDWDNPDKSEWVETLDNFLAEIDKPIVLVGHSLGCITIAHWAGENRREIQGALLVAPADVERSDTPPELRNFRPVPLEPLPFPGTVVISSDDPYISLQRAKLFAKCWGCRLINIGASGHIDTAAGFGPWRQGEVLLQQLLHL